MALFYVFLLLSSYLLLSVHTTNATQQKISYISDQDCFIGNGSENFSSYYSRENNSRVEPAVCDFFQNASKFTNNYQLYRVSGISDKITIEFNETITQTTFTKPWTFVILSNGIVRSQKFNGYHAYRKHRVSTKVQLQCDENGAFTKSMFGANSWTVFNPELLSEQSMNEIRSYFTTVDDFPLWSFVNYSSFLVNTLNNNGAFCSGTVLRLNEPII